ncbi:hypothetical protein F4780DRAFT_788504 [Xylariomycetidae sp. FL0641]|nr:hypothetical protein F4780DRAFT_788504 [Xylariomycetidae sp. FL0641]
MNPIGAPRPRPRRMNPMDVPPLERRSTKRLPFVPDVGDINDVRWGRTSVLDNGLIWPREKTSSTLWADEENVNDPEVTQETIYAMNQLQLTRNEPPEPLTVQVAVEQLMNSLPVQVRSTVKLGLVGVSTIFGAPETEFMGRATKQYGGFDVFYNDLVAAKYFVWPIEAKEGEFVTAIFLMQEAPEREIPEPEIPEIEPPGGIHVTNRPTVRAWSIVDPVRDQPEREQLVRNRVMRILQNIYNVVFPIGSYRERANLAGIRLYGLPWVPPQERWAPVSDTWSSGIRSYTLVKEIFRRITDMFCRDTPDHHIENVIFEMPTLGYLDVDWERHDMRNAATVACLDAMEYRARVCIEGIRELQIGHYLEEPRTDASELAPTPRGKYPFRPGTNRVARPPGQSRSPSPSPPGSDDGEEDLLSDTSGSMTEATSAPDSMDWEDYYGYN